MQLVGKVSSESQVRVWWSRKVQVTMDATPVPRLKKKKFGATKTKQQHSTQVEACKYNGLLYSGGVLVKEPSDIASLVQLGCYGKGIFSRSVPSHNQADFLKPVAKEDGKSGYQQVGWIVGSCSTTGTAADAWLSKLDQFEDSRKRRLHLHAQWKEVEEAIRSGPQQVDVIGQSESEVAEWKPDSRSVPVVEYEHGSSSECIGGLEQNIQSKLQGNLVADFSSYSTHYREFLSRMEQLSEHDPYKMSEHLMLSSAEAFYLANELKILNVENSTGKQLTIGDLWCHFCCHSDGNFAEKYMAYHHYRSKGWVPKSGLKFGVDYLLYKDGPLSYHSSYAVIVRPAAREESFTASAQEGHWTWKEVMAHCRVNEAAGKDLIVCDVVKPSDLTEEELRYPTCLSRYRVCEIFVNRWVPERERKK